VNVKVIYDNFSAIIFAIGLGYSGYSIQSAGLRILFSLFGMLWALLGIEIQRFALSHRRIQTKQLSQSESAAASEQQQPLPTPRLAELRSALIIGKTGSLDQSAGLVPSEIPIHNNCCDRNLSRRV